MKQMVKRLTEAGFEVTSRNIVNQDAIKKFIKNFERDQDPKVIKWLNGAFRNWLLNEAEVEPFRRKLTEKDPEWMKKALERGDKLDEVVLNTELRNKIAHMLDWLRDQIQTEQITDPAGLQVPKALEIAEKWGRGSKTKKKGEDKEGIDIHIITEMPGGWYAAMLISEFAFKREGEKMSHCVGSYYHQYKNGTLFIVSIRDPEDKPWATLEIRPNGTINQIKGHHDRPVGSNAPENYDKSKTEEAQKAAKHFLKEFKAVDSV